MRLRQPRIVPLRQDEYSTAQREALEPLAKRGQLFNIFTTLGHVPEALKAFNAWGGSSCCARRCRSASGSC